MEYSYAQRMEGITGSAIRDIFRLLANPNIISFAGGNPLAASFPADELAKISANLLEKNGGGLLQYGATEGYLPLRESITQIIKDRGIDAQVENILPLSGSSQGIEIVTKLMINPGDCILCENPTFLGALQTFLTYQAKVIGVETDSCGMVMEDLEDKIKQYKPKFIYAIPTFQNPTGVTMTLDRRKRIVELAERYGVLILEDDPYRDLRFKGGSYPAVKSFDETGSVIHLLSFSKTVSPGLRVGAAVARPDILRKMVIIKQGMDVHSPNLNQAMIDVYIRSGRYNEHIKEILPQYAVQMETMLEMLKSFPEGVKYTKPDGGLFIWVELPEGFDAKELMQQAVKRNVAYVPGTFFYPEGGNAHTLRLNFSNSDPEKIKIGMKALGELLAENINK